MAWLNLIEGGAQNISADHIKPHYPFQPDRTYWQLDLGGRDAVQGLANCYGDAGDAGFHGNNIIRRLEEQRKKDVGSVAVYLEYDERDYWPVLGYAFIAEDADFDPGMPTIEGSKLSSQETYRLAHPEKFEFPLSVDA